MKFISHITLTTMSCSLLNGSLEVRPEVWPEVGPEVEPEVGPEVKPRVNHFLSINKTGKSIVDTV